MDKNWVEFFAMPNRPPGCHVCVDEHTSRWVSSADYHCHHGQQQEYREDLLEQATVVPSEPQARSLSRNSVPVVHLDKKRLFPTTDFTTLFNRSTDIRIVQKHDNIARVVISMESHCLRLGMRTVTRALHAQPDRCVTRLFAHHLIRHFDCRRMWQCLG